MTMRAAGVLVYRQRGHAPRRDGTDRSGSRRSGDGVPKRARAKDVRWAL